MKQTRISGVGHFDGYKFRHVTWLIGLLYVLAFGLGQVILTGVCVVIGFLCSG